jgi:hypothetical protein
VPTEEVAELILALHFIAMDPTASPELNRDVVVAVDAICDSLGPGGIVISSSVSTALVHLGVL